MKINANAIFFDHIKSLIKEGKDVRIIVKGVSMFPFFYNEKDYVVLSPLRKELKVGDIVLFQDSQITKLHRIVKINLNNLIIRGDACYNQKEEVDISSVIAIVKEGTCFNGKDFKISSFFYYVYSKIWVITYPLRWGIVKLYRLIKINKKNEN